MREDEHGYTQKAWQRRLALWIAKPDFLAYHVDALPSAWVASLRANGRFAALSAQGVDPMRQEVLPRVVAGVFAVWLCTAFSAVVTLVVSYLVVYGFTPFGWTAYTRTVGQVFGPAVTLVFVVKTLLFSLAVAVVPMAAATWTAPPGRPGQGAAASAELQGLVRMFMMLLLFEAQNATRAGHAALLDAAHAQEMSVIALTSNLGQRYAPQPEILKYANHVADRFNLRPDIQFNTRMTNATYDEQAARWTVDTEDGQTIQSQFLLMCKNSFAKQSNRQFGQTLKSQKTSQIWSTRLRY